MTVVLFDLDGTLIDSVPEVQAALNAVLAERGCRNISRAETIQCISDGPRVMLRKAFEAVGCPLPEVQIETVLERYLEHYLNARGANTTIYPGVLETLEALRDRGVPMAVCTNKPRRSTMAVLQALNMIDFFSAVVCPEDTPYQKPDARHVTATLRAMGQDRVAPSDVVFVGDSETDMAAARNAGVVAVAVSYGYAKCGVASLDCDRLVDGRLDEMLAWWGEMAAHS